MNILYLGNFNTNSVGEPEVAASLESLGHKVTRIDNYKTVLTEVAKIIRENNFDFLLYSKIKNTNVTAEIIHFIEWCKERKLLTVCWLWDLYWGYRPESEIATSIEVEFNADLVITSDGGNDHKWKKYNIRHRVLRQGIMQGVKRGEPIYDTKAEIGFIGSVNTWAGWNYRVDLVNFLKATYGEKFKHFGEGGKIRHENLNNLIATLKIVIGDSVYSPNYWSNRVYEMIGRGAFLITSKVPGLEKEFEYGKHFVPYTLKDFAGLKRKIDYYLEHPKERDIISAEGFKYCHREHTYLKRCEKFIKILKEEKII